MTVIFVTFIFIFYGYVKYITRPRFRFPKDARRKPGEFKVGGYDPETGKQFATTESEAEKSSLQQAIQEVEQLQQRGILTDAEAREKISMIRQQMDAVVMSSSSSSKSIRHRMFGGGGGGGGVGGNGIPGSSTAATASNRGVIDSSAHSSVGLNMVGASEVGMRPTDTQSSAASTSGASVSGSDGSGGREELVGMLVKDKKLHRFALSADGRVLTQAPLVSGGQSKTYEVAGHRVAVVADSKPSTFVATIGKAKLKLGANSHEEMVTWMDALVRAGAM